MESVMMLNPPAQAYCRLAPSERARLIVVIDTEEEFDWSRNFSRANTAVTAMRHIRRVQEIFDRYGITPVYVIDYPVASNPEGYEPLQEIHAAGRCLIGAHLHPWVNPPYDEDVTRFNSFPGNLPAPLEAAKLRVLRDCIGERFGLPPVIYKAGRYGIGSRTADILLGEGFEVDLSVCPFMDYSHEGGPDFSQQSYWPYWVRSRQLLELPLTVGYAGLLRRWGRTIHGMASSGFLNSCRAVGLLARSQLVNKVWLTPEGFLSSEHRKLTKALYSDGLRVFSFAFHSPSVEPGHTPYVASQRDLEIFLSRCEQFFDFFLGKLGGCPTTPLELVKEFRALTPRPAVEGL